MMVDRLGEATRNARYNGLITRKEKTDLLEELGLG